MHEHGYFLTQEITKNSRFKIANCQLSWWSPRWPSWTRWSRGAPWPFFGMLEDVGSPPTPPSVGGMMMCWSPHFCWHFCWVERLGKNICDIRWLVWLPGGRTTCRIFGLILQILVSVEGDHPNSKIVVSGVWHKMKHVVVLVVVLVVVVRVVVVVVCLSRVVEPMFLQEFTNPSLLRGYLTLNVGCLTWRSRVIMAMARCEQKMG